MIVLIKPLVIQIPGAPSNDNLSSVIVAPRFGHLKTHSCGVHTFKYVYANTFKCAPMSM